MKAVLKPDFEDGKIDIEEFQTAMVEAFTEAGISAGEAEDAINGLEGQNKLTTAEAELLRQSLVGLGDDAEEAGTKITTSSGNFDTSFGIIIQALEDAGRESDTFEALYGKVIGELEQTDWKGDAGAAYDYVRERLEELGLSTEELDRQVAASGAFKTIESQARIGAEQTGLANAKISALRDLGIDIEKTGFGGMAKAFGAIVTGAEDADETSGTFKTNFWAMAGGAAVQALAMGLLGGAFTTIGEKAGDADEDVGNLDISISDSVKNSASIKQELDKMDVFGGVIDL